MTDAKPTHATEAVPCVHRWVLGAAQEGATQGICRLCQAVRTFTDAPRNWVGAKETRRRRPRTPAVLPTGDSDPVTRGT